MALALILDPQHGWCSGIRKSKVIIHRSGSSKTANPMLDAAADDSDDGDGDGDGGAEQLLPKLRSDESFLREWLEAEPPVGHNGTL